MANLRVENPNTFKKLKVLDQYHRGGGVHILPGSLVSEPEGLAATLIAGFYARLATPEDIHDPKAPEMPEIDRLEKEHKELKLLIMRKEIADMKAQLAEKPEEKPTVTKK